MVHSTAFVLCQSFDDMRRQLQESIRAQQERVATMEANLARGAPRAQSVSHMVAVATSALAVACAWRMVSDKWRYEGEESALQTIISQQKADIDRCASKRRCLHRLHGAVGSASLVVPNNTRNCGPVQVTRSNRCDRA